MVNRNLITKAELSRRCGVTAAAITKAIKGDLHLAIVGKRIDANHPVVKKYMNTNQGGPTQSVDGVDLLYSDAVAYCYESGRFTASAVARKFKIGYARAQRIFKLMQDAGNTPTPVPPPPPEPAAVMPIPPPPEPDPVPVKKLPPIEPGILPTNKTKKTRSLNALNAAKQSGDTVATDKIIHEIPDDIRAFIDMTLKELIQRFGTDIAFLDWLKATKSIEDINEKRLKNAVTQGDLVSRDLIKIGVIDPINAAHLKLLTDGAKTIARRVTAMHGAGRSVEDCEKFVANQMTSFIKPIKSKVARALKNA